MSAIFSVRRSIILAAFAAFGAVACSGAVTTTDPSLTAADPVTAAPPRDDEPWFMAGSRPADYQWSTEPGDESGATKARRLRHVATESTPGFGTLMQAFSAEKYRGKRVRFSARVRSEAVPTAAGLWMRVDGKGRHPLAFDNMQQRPIQGTTAWTTYAVVLDVPADARGIALGILLNGTGDVWLAGPHLEVVGLEVASTNMESERTPARADFSP